MAKWDKRPHQSLAFIELIPIVPLLVLSYFPFFSLNHHPPSVMPETTSQQLPATKSRHAASAAQSAPRKVRFNVGEKRHDVPPLAFLTLLSHRHTVSSTRCRRRRRVRHSVLSCPSTQWTKGRNQKDSTF